MAKVYSEDICTESKVYMFPQTWGDTSLGFGGFGGQAITTAYTIVIVDDLLCNAVVFFNCKYAYSIENFNVELFKDIKNWRVAAVNEKDKYKRS